MLTSKISNAIEALVDAIREASPEMTAFTLSINCEERRIETSKRTPEQIKAAGILRQKVQNVQEVVGCTSLPELLQVWETVRAEIIMRNNEQPANGDSPAEVDGYQMQPESIWGIGE